MKLHDSWLNALYLAGILGGLAGMYLASFESMFSGPVLLAAAVLSIGVAIATLRRKPRSRSDTVIAVFMLVYGIFIGLMGANPWLWLGFTE